jgi:transcriptional/translational regulatory protein YebC/TACO1
MSGHSKWHNIQGRKNAQDAKRGKIFQKMTMLTVRSKKRHQQAKVNIMMRLRMKVMGPVVSQY